MNFSQSELDKDAYFLRIEQLLNDPACCVFIDTNIFALLYRLYSNARTEFYNWINPLVRDGRIKTPVWVLNEYTNRFINNKTNDYFSPLKNLSTVKSGFQELYNFLKMNVDEDLIRNSSYTNITDYQSDLDTIKNKLDKIEVAAKSKKADYLVAIHNELQGVFQNTVLTSDVFDIMKSIQVTGDSRYLHKLPPGFEDGAKELNSFGDLIIWQEILNFCANNPFKKAIILTNDNKRDWVYAPSKVKENGRVLNNSEFKIADPRLVFEFKLKTNSEDIHIINFKTLTKVLLTNNPGQYNQLAKAQQLDSQFNSEASEENQNTESQIVANPEIGVVAQPDIQIETPAQENLTIERLSYSPQALADIDFPLNDGQPITKVILELKSYNWNRQNHALETFLLFNWEKTEISQPMADKLFIVGRNIYQAGVGGAYGPFEFIQNIRHNITRLNSRISPHLVSGMFYEIYFDSRNIFRKDRFKSALMEYLFPLQTVASMRLVIEFVHTQLQPNANDLLILPSTNPTKVTIQIEYAIIEGDKSWLCSNRITTIKCGNRNLLIATSDNRFFSSFGGIAHEIQERIKYHFVIPNDQVKFQYDPPLTNNYSFVSASGYRLGFDSNNQ